ATAITFSPNSQLLAVANEDGTRLWDVASGKETLHLPFEDEFQRLRALRFTPDGRSIVALRRGSPRYSEQERIVVVQLASRLNRVGASPKIPVTAVEVFPDGRSIAFADTVGTIRRWDITEGKERGRWVGHRGSVGAVAVAPGGRVVASGGE